MSTVDRSGRAELPARGSNLSPFGVAIGCLWVAGAFAVLIFTLSARNQFKPVVLVDEMAIADGARAAPQPSR